MDSSEQECQSEHARPLWEAAFLNVGGFYTQSHEQLLKKTMDRFRQGLAHHGIQSWPEETSLFCLTTNHVENRERQPLGGGGDKRLVKSRCFIGFSEHGRA